MCEKCEMQGISMVLEPLDLTTLRDNVTLPESWQKLKAQGFHPDLVDRAYAHLGWIVRENKPIWINNAQVFLSTLGKGFQSPFDRKQFEPEANDPYYRLKSRALTALTELANEFGDRVTSVMWDSLAHLATREEPEKSRSIIKEAKSLPHHFGIVDTMLHAMGKVYTFAQRVQSVFFKHTGMILVHNCDCNCSLLNLVPVNGAIEFSLNEQQRYEATQSLFTHMCSESHLILDQRLPFEYTITSEAQLLLGTIRG